MTGVDVGSSDRVRTSDRAGVRGSGCIQIFYVVCRFDKEARAR